MATPSTRLDARKELNGLSYKGKKRLLEDESKGVWSGEPTAIRQPSNGGHSINSNGNNPYSRRMASSHNGIHGHGRDNPNPTGRNVLTSVQTRSKKQKFSHPVWTNNGHYGPSLALQNSLGVYKNAGDRPVSFRVPITSPGETSSAPGSAKKDPAEVINIEDDEREAEVSVSLVHSRQDGPLLFQVEDNEPGPSHSATFSHLAKDGESTKRLRDKFENISSYEMMNLGKSMPGFPESLHEDKSDETEDADVLPEHESGASTTVLKRSPPLPLPRYSTPGGTILPLQNVSEKTAVYETKANAKRTYHIPDLRKQGLTGRMKGKQPEKTKSKTETLILTSSADLSARLRWAESKSTLLPSPTLPLETFVWGKIIQEISPDSLKPEYWLIWDNATKELQVQKDPVEVKSSRKRPYKVIKLSSLEGHSLTYSNDANEKLLKIIPGPGSGAPDDISQIGLTFKFLNNHPNLVQYYEEMHRVLKNVANKDDVDTVIGSAVRQCLDISKRASVAYCAETSKGRSSACTSKQTKCQSKEELIKPEVYKFRLDMTPTRRSSRLSEQATIQEDVVAQPDELILVYPPSGPGAINVMQSDLKRLEPSGFLNDTLIEIALKFWINDLRVIDPKLADDIHVFSCFFYKKLANKNFEEGYMSIRKWTSKVDIFKKRYIIVPINENVHWYLAIIYLPEYILLPALESDVPPQRRISMRQDCAESARSYNKDDSRLEDINIGVSETAGNGAGRDFDKADSDIAIDEIVASTGSSPLDDSSDEGDSSPRLGSLSELEVAYPYSLDEHKTDGIRRISNTPDDERSKPVERVFFNFTDIPDHVASYQLGNILRDGLPGGTSIITDSEKEVLDELGDGDLAAAHTESNGDGGSPMDVEIHPESRDELLSLPDDGEATSVPASTFYADASSSRTTCTSSPVGQSLDLDQKEDNTSLDEIDLLSQPEVNERSRTWIFAMDSLGSKHKATMKRLNRYLCSEAKDKKSVENPSEALELNATVPVQPNYCDCGLYLLHFAKTFVSETEKIMNTLCHSPKKVNKEERNELWRSYQVSTMREELKARILEESEKWKAVKQRQKEAQQQKEQSAGDDGARSSHPVESSDDEIEVTEIVHRSDAAESGSSTPKRGGRKSGAKYGRLSAGSSKASRLRG